MRDWTSRYTLLFGRRFQATVTHRRTLQLDTIQQRRGTAPYKISIVDAEDAYKRCISPSKNDKAAITQAFMRHKEYYYGF